MEPCTSDVEDAVWHGGILRLQDVQSDIVDRNAGSGFAVRRAMMGVAVKNEVRPVPVGDFCET